MTGTISFGGIGSGIDTEAIVNGLISASRAGLSPLKSRASSTEAAVSTISSISSLLSSLKSATKELDTAAEVGSFKGTSSSDAVTVTANGNASSGRFSIEVLQLASEQRTYSKTFSSDSDSANINANLGIGLGGQNYSVDIDSEDSLTDIAGKINALDARLAASVIFDGTDYRLRVRGLDTGAENEIQFTGQGATDLDLDENSAETVKAQDAIFKLDNLSAPLTRSTNEVVSAVSGVTIKLNEVTDGPVTIGVEIDADGMKEKLTTFVNAYNAVLNKIHEEAGYGSQKGKNPVLKGDSTLRAITNRLAGSVLTPLGGDYGQTLSSVGIRLNSNGTLRIDETELSDALAADSSRVASVLAGDDTQDGIMDMMRDMVDGFTQSGTGLLATKQETLQDRADAINARIEREEARLEVQAELLRRQFTSMDQTVSANHATLDYIVRMSVG